MSFLLRCLLLVTVFPGVSGCLMVGPDYQRPAVSMPLGNWRAALPHDGSREQLTHWWDRFEDESLTILLKATLDHHPGLDGAKAAIDVARASLTGQEAQARPKGDLGATMSRSGNHGNNPGEDEMSTAATVVDATWELDLFGRVKRATEGANAKVAARQAELQGLRVSLAAEVATLYTEWRGCERLRDSLAAERASREKTAAITQTAIAAGLVAASEGELAQAGLADVRAQWTLQQASCDLVIKGLVVLSGLAEEEVRHLLNVGAVRWPKIAPFAVTVVPVQLLSQRPDLVASEEELVAANAEIGVAEAGRYPRFSLLGSVGIGIADLGKSTLDHQPWSFGPALSLPIMDGGVREANVRSAQGRWQIALANYRQAVRNAVREVESALVNLAALQARLVDGRMAAKRYAAYLSASEDHWRKGGISLLTLEDARRKSIGAQRSVIQLERLEVQQWINLYKALGGGWNPTAAPEGNG
ncbi:MAG: efflux transporter outer membrane subunit [Magnetococcales bacterium]|nr:efflux transporter outer membrane subunit [Magnetococcales bacterium]